MEIGDLIEFVRLLFHSGVDVALEFLSTFVSVSDFDPCDMSAFLPTLCFILFLL
jgi:hypothetical protein